MANKKGIQFFNRVSLRELSLFTRSLSTTISAGLPIVKALTIIKNQTSNDFFKDIIADIVKRLEEGERFSGALAKYPKVFNRVYIASVQAAEASGKFDIVLVDLADTLEKEYKLDSSIKGALAYPLFIVVAMIITATILLIAVVPKIETIFKESDISLPLATRMLIATGGFLASYWYLVLLIAIGVVVWVRYFLKSPQGYIFYSKLLLKTPLIKDLFVAVYMTRFTKTLGMLTQAGVPIINAVKLVSYVVNNAIYSQILKRVAYQLERGVPMSSPLSKTKEFPAIVSQMIAVGEQTGKLDEILVSLTNFYEEETNRKVAMASSLLEPILLVIVGAGVGIMVFSIIVPLYQIAGTIS
jgi:type IV pilus assembly protein PilC